MGKRSKFREARRQQAAGAVCAVLAAHSKRKTAPVVATTWYDFNPNYRAKIEAYRAFALRPTEDWRCRLKSRSEDRRFIDLVRFAFARYPVPAHLENLWLEDVDDDFVDDVRARARRAGAPRRAPGASRPAALVHRRHARRIAAQEGRASLHVEARDASLPRCAGASDVGPGGVLVRGRARAGGRRRGGAQDRADEAARLFGRLHVLEGRGALLRAQSGLDPGDERPDRLLRGRQGGGSRISR